VSHSRPAAAPGHAKAALQALFVTFLWSTSWVLIKLGLGEIPALTFAGLRYGLAFLILLPLALQPQARAELARLTRRDLWRLARLGVVMYGLTQGAQFLALAYLPAQTTSLLLSFSPVLVALLGALLLGEHPNPRQWWGVALYLAGAGLFLYPAGLTGARALGFVVAHVGLFSNAQAALLGRSLGRG
jgi:drug/metabolite transporter (DMT)-like permease